MINTELFNNTTEIQKEVVTENPTLQNITIVINKTFDTCSITLTGQIGFMDTFINVSITTTAETCEEAEDAAWASLNRQKQRLVDAYDNMN